MVEIVTIVDPVEPGVNEKVTGLNDTNGPTGVMVALNETGPENPVLFRLRVAVPDLPAPRPLLVTLDEIEKSP
ncbi:MAG TPA: hypothetical protein VE177_04665, partial [Candidatus Binatus sp.]|nr:hypothetical protein [Candidatus Binatus sp.]